MFSATLPPSKTRHGPRAGSSLKLSLFGFADLDRAPLPRQQHRGRAPAWRHRQACLVGRDGARLCFSGPNSPGVPLSQSSSTCLDLGRSKGSRPPPHWGFSSIYSSASCVQGPRALQNCARELPALEPPSAPAGVGSGNPPSPRPRAGLGARARAPILSPKCLTASGGKQACAPLVLAFDFQFKRQAPTPAPAAPISDPPFGPGVPDTPELPPPLFGYLLAAGCLLHECPACPLVLIDIDLLVPSMPCQSSKEMSVKRPFGCSCFLS